MVSPAASTSAVGWNKILLNVQSRDEIGVIALERRSSVGMQVEQRHFDARLEQSMPCNQTPALVRVGAFLYNPPTPDGSASEDGCQEQVLWNITEALKLEAPSLSA